MNKEQIDRLFDIAYREGWNNSKDGSYSLDKDAWSYKRALERFRKIADEFRSI